MKPIKIITIKDMKTLRDFTERARFQSGDILEGLKAKAATFAATAWASRPVDEYLSEVNGRATTHTYGWSDVQRIVTAAEDDLARSGVTVANRAGTVVVALSGVPEAKAYARASRSAIATKLTLRRTTSAWVLESAAKVERYTGPGGGEKVSTTISAAARDDIIKTAMTGYAVKEEPNGA